MDDKNLFKVDALLRDGQDREHGKDIPLGDQEKGSDKYILDPVEWK